MGGERDLGKIERGECGIFSFNALRVVYLKMGRGRGDVGIKNRSWREKREREKREKRGETTKAGGMMEVAKKTEKKRRVKESDSREKATELDGALTGVSGLAAAEGRSRRRG